MPLGPWRSRYVALKLRYPTANLRRSTLQKSECHINIWRDRGGKNYWCQAVRKGAPGRDYVAYVIFLGSIIIYQLHNLTRLGSNWESAFRISVNIFSRSAFAGEPGKKYFYRVRPHCQWPWSELSYISHTDFWDVLVLFINTSHVNNCRWMEGI
jgi:hypothetical protein